MRQTHKHYRIYERPFMPGDGGCDAVLINVDPKTGEYDDGTRYKSYEEAWAQIAGDSSPGDIILVEVFEPSNVTIREDPDGQGPAWVVKKIAARGEGPFNE